MLTLQGHKEASCDTAQPNYRWRLKRKIMEDKEKLLKNLKEYPKGETMRMLRIWEYAKYLCRYNKKSNEWCYADDLYGSQLMSYVYEGDLKHSSGMEMKVLKNKLKDLGYFKFRKVRNKWQLYPLEIDFCDVNDFVKDKPEDYFDFMLDFD